MLFEGGRAGADRFLKTLSGSYYVYILCRPDGQPFYVGKGINRRALEHEAEALRNHPVGESNPFKCNVIRKIVREGGQITYRIDSQFELADQMQCLWREAELIAQHRRLHEGGSLTNLAGGVGSMAGAAPFSLERHAATLSGEPVDNPERAILNRFLQGIGSVGSVPVKPVTQISRILPTTPHPSARSPTMRCAYALVASAAATGTQLAAPPVSVPRAFRYQAVDAVIENGVARDILKAGMANLEEGSTPLAERFRLHQKHLDILIGLVGREMLDNRGLV